MFFFFFFFPIGSCLEYTEESQPYACSFFFLAMLWKCRHSKERDLAVKNEHPLEHRKWHFWEGKKKKKSAPKRCLLEVWRDFNIYLAQYFYFRDKETEILNGGDMTVWEPHPRDFLITSGCLRLSWLLPKKQNLEIAYVFDREMALGRKKYHCLCH